MIQRAFEDIRIELSCFPDLDFPNLEDKLRNWLTPGGPTKMVHRDTGINSPVQRVREAMGISFKPC
jgi:hypothetical protein